MADPGEGPGGKLILDHSEARRAEKIFFAHLPPPPPFISRSGSDTAYATRTELNLVCDAFFFARYSTRNPFKPPATSRVLSRTVLISYCNIFICNRAGWDENRGTGRILRGTEDCKQSTVTQAGEYGLWTGYKRQIGY